MTNALARPLRLDLNLYSRLTGVHPELIRRLVRLGLLEVTRDARGDLWLVGTRVLAEVDGDVHLPVKQQRKDLDRSRRLNAVGWERRGYTTHDLVTRPIAVLRDADRATGRTHESSRIRAWHALLAESVLSAAGRTRLEARLASRSGGSSVNGTP